MKKGIALLLALALSSLFTAAQALELAGLEEGDEIVWEESRFFASMEQVIGEEITALQYQDAVQWQEAKDAMLAGEAELPDALFKARLTPQEEEAMLAAGVIIDLEPLLEEYAPNLFTILQARPEWLEAISLPDGRIASLPALSGAERQCCVWICRQWLDTLGIGMPQNIDEFTQALRAIRDGDPNGNGKQDEIPLSLCGPWEAKFLLHAFGLAPNDYNVFARDGEVVFAPFEEEYRAFVEWLKMAMEEGLINDDAFRLAPAARSTAASLQTDSDLTIGAMISIAPYTLVPMDDTLAYEALVPLEYDSQRVFRELVPAVSRGTFAITSACDDVETALAFADYLYTEAGGRLAFAGEEGVDYLLQEDGSWKWNVEDYALLTELVEGCVIAGDGLTPGLEPAAFMRNGEIEADNYVRRQTDAISSYFVAPMPLCRPLEAAEEERIAQLQEALGTCVDTAIANFAMGIVPLDDEHWDGFLSELTELGAQEFTALWQKKYDAAKE